LIQEKTRRRTVKRLRFIAKATAKAACGVELPLDKLPLLVPFVTRADIAAGNNDELWMKTELRLGREFDGMSIACAMSMKTGVCIVMSLDMPVYPMSMDLNVQTDYDDRSDDVTVPKGYLRVLDGLSRIGDLFLPEPGDDGKLPASWTVVEMDEADKTADGFFILVRRVDEADKKDPEELREAFAEAEAAEPPVAEVELPGKQRALDPAKVNMTEEKKMKPVPGGPPGGVPAND